MKTDLVNVYTTHYINQTYIGGRVYSQDEIATVKVYEFKDEPFLKIDVHLFSIPNMTEGIDVTFNIQSDLENSNTFYTDSNGLAMQKRVKGSRPTNTLKTD